MARRAAHVKVESGAQGSSSGFCSCFSRSQSDDAEPDLQKPPDELLEQILEELAALMTHMEKDGVDKKSKTAATPKGSEQMSASKVLKHINKIHQAVRDVVKEVQQSPTVWSERADWVSEALNKQIEKLHAVGEDLYSVANKWPSSKLAVATGGRSADELRKELEAHQHAEDAILWSNLGAAGGGKVGGTPFTKVGCYIEATGYILNNLELAVLAIAEMDPIVVEVQNAAMEVEVIQDPSAIEQVREPSVGVSPQVIRESQEMLDRLYISQSEARQDQSRLNERIGEAEKSQVESGERLGHQIETLNQSVAELLEAIQRSHGQTEEQVAGLQRDLHSSMSQVNGELGAMRDQVGGALERTQQLLTLQKADNLRGEIDQIGKKGEARTEAIEDNLKKLHLQMQALEGYASYVFAPPSSSKETPVLQVPGEFRTIQEALDAVQTPGSRVEVRPGVYKECIRLQGMHVEILGLGGRDGVVLEGRGNENVVYVAKEDAEEEDTADPEDTEGDTGDPPPKALKVNAKISGVTILHQGMVTDHHPYGALCVEEGCLIIQDCVLSSLAGAGVYIQGAETSCRLVGSTVQGCRESGVLVSQGAHAAIETSKLQDNYLDGVCVQNGAQLRMSRCQLSSNDRGVQVLGEDTEATIEFNDIIGNERTALHIEPSCHKVSTRNNTTEPRWTSPHNSPKPKSSDICSVLGSTAPW